VTRPQRGGRVTFDALALEAGGVRYRAELSTPEAEWQGVATVDAAGAVELAAWSPEAPAPPAWLLDYARAFLRAEWRARQATDPAPWPERISRWRG
jgi:hypothetical protein